MCSQYSAYIRAEANVANTYRETSLCYVLSIVSGKNRHTSMIGLKTVDSFRQEEAGQGYVDFHEGFGNPGRALRLVWMTQNWSLNQLVLYREYQRNLQRAGQYGLADGKCEGHSRAESDRIRSEGGAIG